MDTPNGELIPQGGGDNIPLVRSPLLLGRRESCDITLQFANVSGRHCELTFKDGFWLIRDLDSTNGIKVNDLLVQRKILHTGDLITIGTRTFQLQYTESGRPLSLEEYEEELDDIFSVPLLEKAGLARPPRHARTPKPEGEDAAPDDE
jgi:pSer/pThr/pTyr-binding forkhead associated (FHA) protein